jgi:ABC-type Fe3+/spermidine/putrescine transport system ATPase subunit
VRGWSVEGVRARLDGFSLGPLDLELPVGRTVAVLGSSGAGKTTLLRALAGFVPLEGGRLRRDGVDVGRLAPEERGLGYVPQGLGLIPTRNVERNVSYPLEVRGRTDARARGRAMLERFGLTPLARRYPAQLSGGELERVALARALLAEPELVLWDEPWQALDVEARHQLSFVFEELRDRARVPALVVTHDPELAFSVADEFVVLRRGRGVFRGVPAELLARPVDRFTARFVGFENVYDRTDLSGAPAGSFGAWLLERAGDGGIALARPRVGRGDPGAWTASVRRARPSPEGVAITASVGPLTVFLRGDAAERPPAVGQELRFDVEEAGLRPLAGTDRPPEGAAA